MMTRLLRHVFPGERSSPRPHSALDWPIPIQIAQASRPEANEGDTGLERSRQALREAFTPSRPQRGGKRLIGRRPQLARILRALNEERTHVVLYAERGRGKTSLANLLVETLRAGDHVVARHTCATDSDFESIVRSLARDLPAPLLAARAAPDESLAGCEAALPAGPVQPCDIVALPSRLAARQLVLVVDEFDRILDQTARTRLADTIKQISDRGAPLFFVIIGVSDSLEELLGRHPSIQRNVVGVPLPLLSGQEIEAIVERGAAEAGLHFTAKVRRAITVLARGVPYIAQLLSLRAGQAALERGVVEVTSADLLTAIAMAVEEADPRVVALYDGLTDRGRDHQVAAVLRAMASGQLDHFGRFSVEPAAGGGDALLHVAGAPVASELFSHLAGAGVVRPCAGVAPGVYTFSEAMLPHYILLRELLDREVAVAGGSGSVTGDGGHPAVEERLTLAIP